MNTIEAIEHWLRIGGFVAFLVLLPCAIVWWVAARRRAHADYLKRKRIDAALFALRDMPPVTIKQADPPV